MTRTYARLVMAALALTIVILTPTAAAQCDLQELNTVEFEFGASYLDTRGAQRLTDNARLLRANVDCEVYVDGYTDSRESTEFGPALSARRARTVVNFYLDQGVDAQRLRIQNRGQASPDCDKEDPGPGCRRNRRVESIPDYTPPARPARCPYNEGMTIDNPGCVPPPDPTVTANFVDTLEIDTLRLRQTSVALNCDQETTHRWVVSGIIFTDEFVNWTVDDRTTDQSVPVSLTSTCATATSTVDRTVVVPALERDTSHTPDTPVVALRVRPQVGMEVLVGFAQQLVIPRDGGLEVDASAPFAGLGFTAGLGYGRFSLNALLAYIGGQATTETQVIPGTPTCGSLGCPSEDITLPSKTLPRSGLYFGIDAGLQVLGPLDLRVGCGLNTLGTGQSVGCHGGIAVVARL